MAVEKATLEDLLRRVDAMMAELAALREELRTVVPPAHEGGLVADALYGVLGQGAPDEYEAMADWERFA